MAEKGLREKMLEGTWKIWCRVVPTRPTSEVFINSLKSNRGAADALLYFIPEKIFTTYHPYLVWMKIFFNF